MTNKNEGKILDSIVDVNYENHFNKEFEGKTVESNKTPAKPWMKYSLISVMA